MRRTAIFCITHCFLTTLCNAETPILLKQKSAVLQSEISSILTANNIKINLDEFYLQRITQTLAYSPDGSMDHCETSVIYRIRPGLKGIAFENRQIVGLHLTYPSEDSSTRLILVPSDGASRGGITKMLAGQPKIERHADSLEQSEHTPEKAPSASGIRGTKENADLSPQKP